MRELVRGRVVARGPQWDGLVLPRHSPPGAGGAGVHNLGEWTDGEGGVLRASREGTIKPEVISYRGAVRIADPVLVFGAGRSGRGSRTGVGETGVGVVHKGAGVGRGSGKVIPQGVE